MKDLGPASEDEMVLAFLQAEVASPRWPLVAQLVQQTEIPTLISEPRLDDAAENCARREVLGVHRGFGRGQGLFAAFPADCEWSRVLTSRQELGAFLYANCPPWIALSGGSRRVRDGAVGVDTVPADDTNANVHEIERAMTNGTSYPALIAVAEQADGVHVLLEGHTRATAYCRQLDGGEIEIIVGRSPGMANWHWWGEPT